jgi:hypothetical protein
LSLGNELLTFVNKDELVEVEIQGNKGQKGVIDQRMLVYSEIPCSEMGVILEEILCDNHIQ